jgi:hypothetical protein
MTAPFRFKPTLSDTAWGIRRDIAEHLLWMRMHVEHALDYAEFGHDTLAKASLRRAGIYYEAAQGALEALFKLGDGADARKD